MKFIFNLITVASLRFRLLTYALVMLLLVLGGVAVSQLNQELLPPIDLPQTIILAQANGMTSEQVLEVLTKRLEPEISGLEEIINLESTTTGAFGTIMTAYNDFGENQDNIQENIRQAISNVWLPIRSIRPPEGEDPQAFAQRLLSEMPAEPLIYISEFDSNFFFQLAPEVWSVLPDETVETVLAYLAAQVETEQAGASALARLVEKEVVPQLRTIGDVANVTIEGGQALPGEEENFAVADADLPEVETRSLLLRLAPDVWEVVAPRVDGLNALDQSAVETLSAIEVTIPEEAPALAESWQQDHFNDASDLIEVRTLTASVGDLFNDFYQTGTIVGALGQTDDLTPETVTRYLEIDPTLVQYFEAEQLVAMLPEVFAVLPPDFIANLDGFTRDELAAAALAQTITGEDAVREPVDLPGPWRIQQPQLITFSFADIPLATFSVASTGGAASTATNPDADTTQGTEESVESTDEGAAPEQADQTTQEIPEGPALPPIFLFIGQGFGVTLDTADDLINLTLPEDFAEQSGIDSLSAAQLLNFIVAPPELPEGTDAPATPQLDPSLLIGGLSAEIISFLAENDPAFISELNPLVFNYFSDAVLALPEVAPPLADAWDVLSSQPQFAESPLNNAGDVVRVGDGEASSVLNAINANVPAEFEGYEVRLFDSLTPAVVRYFIQEEPNFYQNLDAGVLQKLNPEVLSILPDELLAELDNELAAELTAIASGEQNSAFVALQELYTSNVPASDPDAPALNPEWGFLESGYGIELDSADDFFRFPDGYQYEDAAALINSIFESAQGANFAPALLVNLPLEAIEYILNRDASVLSGLDAQALREFSDEGLALLPNELQQRALEGGEVFEPENWVTRTNAQPSLFVTVYKDADANTVSTFADVEDLMTAVDEANENIDIGVVFEQSSFIEESISGVAREGTLGAVFAIIIILIFLSSGTWNMGWRRRVGVILIVLFTGLLIGLVALGLEAAGNDWGQAFAQADTVVRVLLLVGIIAGFIVTFWPGNLPDPSWRATIVIAVSIPLSIFTSFVLMRWFSPFMYSLISPLAENSPIFEFVLRLFPEELTLNIMTLSGLTVAVGRVVDDSIVVLENIVRQVQAGGDKREAVLSGTRDVSAAIFTATFIAIVVFLPLGLTGGIIGAFFLPFGLSLTYALVGSFIVAITVVPVLAYLTTNPDDLPEDEDMKLADYYRPILKWSIANNRNKWIVIAVALLSMIFGFFLFSQRPFAFLPNFGEPQISVAVELPSGTSIIETNEKVAQLENFVTENVPEEQVSAIQTTIGGQGASFDSLLGGGGVAENAASMTIGLDVAEGELDEWAQTIRTEANTIFGEEYVTVSAASVADGGFGGFSLVVSGPEEELVRLDPLIIETLESIEGITNVSSNLSETAASEDGPVTYIRINQESALSYSAELETENTIGVTQQAILAIQELDNLPETVTVSEGFQSEIQTQGFNSLPIAMGIAFLIVILILIFTFGSLVYWLALTMSIFVAPVGAAIALTLTDRVLGISALIGLLMLLGLVITNAVVLIDRVRSNRTERGMNLYDSLVEAGGRRLRPILMTSLATIIALIPLAVGLSEGAIIAAELGTVVIGGVLSSTLLTLIVVPVAYSLLNPIHRALSFGRSVDDEQEKSAKESASGEAARAGTD